MAAPSICLTMIVKNESKIITRCFDSAKPIINSLSVCDTGSTDETIEIMTKWAEDNKIPYKIHQDTFRDFGYSRTKSYLLAKQSFPQTDYFLLLDADMILETKEHFKKEDLVLDGYRLIQYNPFTRYDNIRLLSNRCHWVCWGVTHEYWDSKDKKEVGFYPHLVIDDRNDGGSKSNKFQRDLYLLEKGLSDPKTPPFLIERYLFYAGQTETSLGNVNSAINYYKKRISMGGWKEEIFFSYYKIGSSYNRLAKNEDGKTDKSKHRKEKYTLLSREAHREAFNMAPDRAEPLVKIARSYRKEGKNHLAQFYAEKARSIKLNGSSLFLDNRINFRLNYEYSINLYFLGRPDLCRIYGDKVLFDHFHFNHYRDSIYRNYRFLFLSLKDFPGVTKYPIITTLPPDYRPLNPSIVKVDQGYIVNLRSVNYLIVDGLYHKNDEKIRTRNFILSLNKDFEVISSQELIDQTDKRKYPHGITGLEDCRIIYRQGKIFFTTTSWDYHEEEVPKIYCGSFDYQWGHKGQEPLIVRDITMLRASEPNQCEKNWIPFFIEHKEIESNNIVINHDGKEYTKEEKEEIIKSTLFEENDNLYPFYILYTYNPLTIIKFKRTGAIDKIITKSLKFNFSGFRGSSGGLYFKDGYLFIIHEVIFTERRIYAHRLLWIDKFYDQIKCSHLFIFNSQGIEYCSGMTYSHNGEDIIITMGSDDKEAWIYILPLKEIDSMLYLPEL